MILNLSLCPVCGVQLHISLLLSDGELTVSLQTKGHFTCHLLPLFMLWRGFQFTLQQQTPKKWLVPSMLWFIKLIKVLLDISGEEGCRPGMDVYGRLFQSSAAAGCKHKLLWYYNSYSYSCVPCCGDVEVLLILQQHESVVPLELRG